jgi:hypothetical protein
VTYADAKTQAKEIDSALRADDPRFGRAVHMIHDEGSTFFWECAFVVDIGDKYISIFTEHHGFHVYDRDDVVSVKQYAEIP